MGRRAEDASGREKWRVALPGGLEAHYRRQFLASDYRTTAVGLAILALPAMILAPHDFTYLADRNTAWLLLALRLLVFGWGAALLLKFRRGDDPRAFDRHFAVWGAAFVAGVAMVRLTRPPDYLANFALEGAILFCLLLFLAVGPGLRMGIGLFFFLTGLATLWFHRTHPGWGPLGTYTAGLCLSLLGGAFLAFRLDNLRRRFFLAQREMEKLAAVDDLTGLLNRRRFLEKAQEEFVRQRRYGQPLALVGMDLDGFKDINDRYGHAAGDRVLREFAKVTRGQVRGSDSVGRLGGEEFGLLMPSTGLEQAAVVAERIRLEFGRARVPAGDGQMVGATLSLGVCQVAPQDGDWEAVMARCDQALYAAKRAGRDRVALAPPPVAPPKPLRPQGGPEGKAPRPAA